MQLHLSVECRHGSARCRHPRLGPSGTSPPGRTIHRRGTAQEGLPPLAWYDALLELERADPPGLRPFELQKAMLFAQYNLSRLVDRLEAAGYVARSASEEDGRGQRLTITKSGRALRRRMWPVYADAIAAAVGSRLSEPEATTLGDLLGRLYART
jgi:DNA-binding MarR family transcriptional regulator